jgi:hypothetical protein
MEQLFKAKMYIKIVPLKKHIEEYGKSKDNNPKNSVGAALTSNFVVKTIEHINDFYVSFFEWYQKSQCASLKISVPDSQWLGVKRGLM